MLNNTRPFGLSAAVNYSLMRCAFSTSKILWQLPNHRLYPRLDWSRLGGGFYAVVDPMDNDSILYLSEKEYKIQIRVSVSQDTQLVVLARPGESKLELTSTSTNTPPENSPNSGASIHTPPPSREEILQREDGKWVRRSYLANGAVVDLVYDDDGSTVVTAKSRGSGRSTYLPKRIARVVMSPLGVPYNTHTSAHIPGSVVSIKPWARWPFMGWHVSRLEKYRIQSGNQLLVALTGDILLSLLYHWGLDLNVRAGGQLVPRPAFNKALAEMAGDLNRILLTRGCKALILKMKNTLFFLNKWLAGSRPCDPFSLGEPVGLARSGLPRIIPLYFRRQIGSKNLAIIRMMESILKAYSAFEGPHSPSDLATVTGSAPALCEETLNDFKIFCKEQFWPEIVGNYLRAEGKSRLLKPRLTRPPESGPFLPVRCGPNHPVAILGAPQDALAWAGCPRNYPLMWAEHVGDTQTVDLFHRTLEAASDGMVLMSTTPPTGRRLAKWQPGISYDTGRLALLPEAAGKVRTIAIADYWTQRLMKPVHDWMMEVLSVLPTDGTFDQEESLRSYVRETQGVSFHSSIDLKSATDMIPIELYEAVLSGVWEEETVTLWRALLTDRWFRTPEGEEALVIDPLKGVLVEYARGQPMGTLSSWASMALVHHALELFAAKRAGLDPATFTSYRVLGDDNVTGNPDVAISYKELCSALQVPISSSKTLEGKLFIFASQVYLDGQNISPLSLKEEIGIKTFSQRVELALRAASRGWMGDKPTSAKLLRLLLRRRDYLRSVREFNLGRLGQMAQAALVSAFGVSAKILSKLGLQGSGSVPFLLVLSNRVQALAGDRNHLDRDTLDLVKDVESLLAIHTTREVVGMMKRELDSLRNSVIRWNEWREGMAEFGLLPLSWRQGPIQWILEYPEKGNWANLSSSVQGTDAASWSSYSQALWHVLQDTYDPYLGVATVDPGISDWELSQAEDLGIGDELGMGVTFSARSSETVTTGGWIVTIPLLERELTNIYSTASALLDSLVKGNADGSPHEDPWSKVDEVLELHSKLPRLPEFFTLDSLSPDRSPKAMDECKAWVSQMRAFHTAMTHLSLSIDFSVVESNPLPEVDEADEALRQMSKELLLSLKKGIPSS